MLDEYPKLKDNNVRRNEIRDQIIAIARKADQGKRKFLTFVDIYSTSSSLNDFHQFILSALLQCKIERQMKKENRQQHQRDVVFDFSPEISVAIESEQSIETKSTINS